MINYFKDLPEEKLEAVIPLVQNYAFLTVTLERLQTEINESALVETYTNGKNQSGVKILSQLQTYSSLIRNYTALANKLEKLMPMKADSGKLSEFVISP